MSTVIEAKNLNLWYGAHHALHDVNMRSRSTRSPPSSAPSGCGKSTFLKTLNRMNDLVEGIRIDGRDQLRRSEHLRPRRGHHLAAQADRHGVPEGQPLPHVHL